MHTHTVILLSIFFTSLVIVLCYILKENSARGPECLFDGSIELVSKERHQKRRFVDLCREVTPPCHPNPLLLDSGHLHTLWNLVAAYGAPRCQFNRILIEQEDPRYPGSFAIDFLSRKQKEETFGDVKKASKLPHTKLTGEEREVLASQDSRPMIIILPGLGGGSEEEYIQETCQSVSARSDWEIAVVNSRGCSRTVLTSKLFYHAGSTWDFAQTIDLLAELFPNRPLFALGFSLGANILTNYVADQGEKCTLKAAMTISNPWDLQKALIPLQSSWFGRETYLRSLGTTLKLKVLANVDQIRANKDIDLHAVRRARYLPEFDLAVQIPMWGFKSVHDYYSTTSSAHRVGSVAIPLLSVNALDDPVASGTAIPISAIKRSRYVVLCLTEHGGHVGWHRLRGGRWTASLVRSYFDEMRNWEVLSEFDTST